MRKHRKCNGTSNLGFNANERLPSACQGLIESLSERIRGETFAAEYLRKSFLSKFNGEGTASSDARRNSAIGKWELQERVNAGTNQRLRGMDRGFNILPRITFYRFLGVVQHHIAEVLGPISSEMVLGSFTGGASTSRPRTSSRPAGKYVGQVDATPDTYPYLDLIRRESETYRQYGFLASYREVNGAVLFTVPKNSEIDRCACKEPDVNMFLQKAVGDHIRGRLRRVGINLNDQSINRRLAHKGSVDGSLATIDLAAASDSITRSCVQALLPTEWFLYLNDIRSRFVSVDGTYSETEMFSSMGNGFTFELESLIFWALARATAYFEGISGVISVYGDDLIVPVGMYEAFTWILTEFGFRVNELKSFHSGSFRESCGGHYNFGQDVTPFYLKRPPTHLTDLIRVCNQLRRWALIDDGRQYEHPELFSIWSELAAFVPLRLWGGHNLDLDTQLASPTPFRDRLSRIGKNVREPEVGRYLMWLTNTRDRVGEQKDAFPSISTTTKCRYRRAKPGALASQFHFHEEV